VDTKGRLPGVRMEDDGEGPTAPDLALDPGGPGGGGALLGGPGPGRQRIVGERSETRLPVRDFRYYLDRLTLVQYGFGD
jgi:hypothetical protein